MSEQTPTPATNSLPLDDFFSLLSERRRRTALAVLADRDGDLTVNDLTKEILVRETDASILECSGDEVTNVYTSLMHVHVPKLAATQLVDYDEERKLVKPTATLDRVAPFVSTVAEADSVAPLAR